MLKHHRNVSKLILTYLEARPKEPKLSWTKSSQPPINSLQKERGLQANPKEKKEVFL